MNRSKFLVMSIEAGRATPPAAQDVSVTSTAGGILLKAPDRTYRPCAAGATTTMATRRRASGATTRTIGKAIKSKSNCVGLRLTIYASGHKRRWRHVVRLARCSSESRHCTRRAYLKTFAWPPTCWYLSGLANAEVWCAMSEAGSGCSETQLCV